jgi:hypothetical protein
MGRTEASFGSQEQMILERIARAERMLAAQRERVLRYEARGLDLAESRALLRLMESVTKQFHLALALFRTYGRLPGDPSTPTVEEPPSATTANVPVAARGLATQTLCSLCGLKLDWGSRNGDPCDGNMLTYDINEWERCCRHRGLQTPALCQLLPHRLATVH